MTETLILPSDLAARVRARVESGAESDPVDVVRAGLEALEAAEAAEIEFIRAKVERALADPRPSIPADEVFGRIRALLDAKRNG